ncbi:MAG: SDR family NAD(P)-dependent oxidoreductase, partial [Thermoleophilaceae bacterium]|nr:SDR family NAD(P)-dependent oxidoreductase [Thermoleophilaceae bacterium]
AGRYNGTFTEEMFEEEQALDFPYERTKFEAEQIVREDSTRPWRVYRPAIVVGSSVNGEIDKIDGPYLLFGYLKKLAATFPKWLPTPGIVGGKMNIVPVDYVADAIVYLVHRKAGDGKAFHLVDPYPPSTGEALSIFARAANAPAFSFRTSNPMIQSLPRLALTLTEYLPPARRATDEILRAVGLPRQMVMYLDTPTKFACQDTLKALDGSGLGVPPLESYANRLWDFWERNFDPSVVSNTKLQKAVNGKIVVVTGASSGIGEAVAYRVARSGAKVILVSRTRSKLELMKREIEAAGGEAAVHPADLADLDDVERVANEILEEHGHVDILVNNAGRSIRRSVAGSYDRFHDFERTMQLNYFGALKLILAFLPVMRDRG